MASSKVTIVDPTTSDVIAEDGDWKIINFKVRASAITEEVLKQLDNNLNTLHFEPYYKGKVKFQELAHTNLVYQLLRMSQYSVKESPEIDKVYTMMVPKDWDYKRTDELILHALITYYYQGVEGQLRYKIEMRPTSSLLSMSEIDQKRMYQAVKFVYHGDKNISHTYLRLMEKRKKITNLIKTNKS